MTLKNIRPIKTRISPDFLDTIGKSFKFKHGKGIAEWLKNSLDQYLRLHKRREETLTGGWPVIIHLIDGAGQSKGPNLAVIDFGGTTSREIEEFFLYWGDTSAASHGGSVHNVALTGGHGNGGKFYMREMWRDGARFLTWKRGKATSLVVKKMEGGTTGYYEIEDVAMDWRRALEVALAEDEHLGGADEIIQHLETTNQHLFAELNNQLRGLTVVVGKRALQTASANDVVSGGKWRPQQLIDEIRQAQQARRPIRELSISVFVNGHIQIEKLTPQSIEEDSTWGVEVINLLDADINGFSTLPNGQEIGLLKIHKSADQLTGRLKDLNALFVSDEKSNPIATYPIHELAFPGYSPLMSFIHAEF